MDLEKVKMLVSELKGMCEVIGIQYGEGYEPFNLDVFEVFENKVKEIHESLVNADE